MNHSETIKASVRATFNKLFLTYCGEDMKDGTNNKVFKQIKGVIYTIPEDLQVEIQD